MKVTIAGVEETGAFTYQMRRGINKNLGDATILVADYQGAKTQAYPFNSKGYKPVSIEDPTGTVIFSGRIKSLSSEGSFLVLSCEGWIAQMNDVNIPSHDTKEILKSGTTNREGIIGSVSGTQILSCTVGGLNPGWASNQWADGTYAVVFPDKLNTVDRQEWDYCISVDPPNYEYGYWINGDHTYAHTQDWDHQWGNVPLYCVSRHSNYENHYYGWQYYLKLGVQFQTSIQASQVTSLDLTIEWGRIGGRAATCNLMILRTDGGMDSIDTLSSAGGNQYKESAITTISPTDHIFVNGIIKFLMITDDEGYEQDSTVYFVDYAKLVVHYTGSIMTTTFPITGNTDDDITSSVNFQTMGVAANDPFNICRMTSEHVKTLVQAYDVQKTLSVTHVHTTNNYVACEWKEAKALQIIAELANEDKTDFWVDLSENFHYNETYSSSGKSIDDDDMLVQPIVLVPGEQMVNEAHIWGHKYTSYEVSAVRSNPASQTDFGVTRSTVERDTTIYTTLDAQLRGDAILERYAYPAQQFQLSLPGKKNHAADTIDIGDYIHLVISKYAVDTYVLVTEKEYEPVSNKAAYTLAKVGSSAKFTPLDPIMAILSMGDKVNRLMLQAAERT